MISSRRLARIVLATSLAAVLLVGCSKNTTAPDANSTPNLNSDKPNANARIQVQATLGDPAKGSQFFQMSVVDGSSYYFAGRRDNLNGVGRLGSTGALQWFTQLPYTLRAVLTLPPSVSVPSGLVVAGKHDSNGDGLSENGYVWLFTASGSRVSTVLFASDSSNIWVNSIAAISESAFVLVGGERTPTRTNPMVAIVTLTAAGQLAKGSVAVLSSLSNSFFDRVAVNPAGPGAGVVRIYASSELGIGSTPATSVSVHGLAAAFPAMSSWNVEWSREIPGSGPTRQLNDLRVYEDRIYVAGHTDDNGKNPRPSNGGYWDSGLAARLTLLGALEWTNPVRLTAHSEGFDAVVPTVNGIFFVGNAGRYFTGADQFGYGWITRVLPATGAVTTNLTFGQDAFRSSFEAGVYNGSTMYCAGFTNYETTNGGYLGWFSGIDVANTVTSPTPDLARTGPLVPPPVTASGSTDGRRCPPRSRAG